MNSQPIIISCIVTSYKREKHIVKRALDSILSQTFENYEILLIDDNRGEGSETFSEALKELCSLSERIRLFKTEGGHGAQCARNTGIRHASGKYLAFLDGDDYLEPDAYERMLGEMTAAGADVIQCSFRDVFVNKSRDRVVVKDRMEFTTLDAMRRFTTDWTSGLLWDKLYRRKLFEGVFFEEGHKIDDEYFTYQGIMNASRILRLPDVVYNYRKRASAVMQSPDAKQQIVLDKIDYLAKRREKVLARFPELRQDYDHHYLSLLVRLSRDAGATRESIMISRRMIRDYFRQKNRSRIDRALRVELLKLLYTP